MHADSELEALQSAKRVVQWMGIGVMPSHSNARLARDAIAPALGSAPQAHSVLGAIEIGVAPSVALCQRAARQIEEIIERSRETHTPFSRSRDRG